jgi:hypothetical protein
MFSMMLMTEEDFYYILQAPNQGRHITIPNLITVNPSSAHHPPIVCVCQTSIRLQLEDRDSDACKKISETKRKILILFLHIMASGEFEEEKSSDFLLLHFSSN